MPETLALDIFCHADVEQVRFIHGFHHQKIAEQPSRWIAHGQRLITAEQRIKKIAARPGMSVNLFLDLHHFVHVHHLHGHELQLTELALQRLQQGVVHAAPFARFFSESRTCRSAVVKATLLRKYSGCASCNGIVRPCRKALAPSVATCDACGISCASPRAAKACAEKSSA